MNRPQSEEATAFEAHKNVPPNWYELSVQTNLLQRFWHSRRIALLERVLLPVKGCALDVGCADGFITSRIADATGATQVVGIDFKEDSIVYARNRYCEREDLSFKVACAQNVPFGDSTFDAVTAIEVLEHVVDPVSVLSEVLRVLKRGGKLYIIVPTESIPFKLIWFAWTRFRGKVWQGTHANKLSVDQLIVELQHLGYTNMETHYFLLGMLVAIICCKR